MIIIFLFIQLRERLLTFGGHNGKNLDLIETSLFALVLDENSPVADTEVCIIDFKVGDLYSYLTL